MPKNESQPEETKPTPRKRKKRKDIQRDTGGRFKAKTGGLQVRMTRGEINNIFGKIFGPNRVARLTRQLAALAEGGDKTALFYIFDRLMGKPVAMIESKVEHSDPAAAKLKVESMLREYPGLAGRMAAISGGTLKVVKTVENIGGPERKTIDARIANNGPGMNLNRPAPPIPEIKPEPLLQNEIQATYNGPPPTTKENK